MPNKKPAQQFLLDIAIPYAGAECLIWPFRRTQKGYAQLIGPRPGRKQINVSRHICIAVNGEPQTPKHQAAHLCGNGHLGCVNPKHLVWKTQKENQADRIIHGTSNSGSRNGSAKLDEHKVVAISKALSKGASPSSLSSTYGVSRAAIYNIISGSNWSHVTGRTNHG